MHTYLVNTITCYYFLLLLDQTTHNVLLHAGAQCPNSHGLAEALLHPCSYRTSFCTDPMCGGDLACALAHSWEELRLPECMPAPCTKYLAAQDEVGIPAVTAKLTLFVALSMMHGLYHPPLPNHHCCSCGVSLACVTGRVVSCCRSISKIDDDLEGPPFYSSEEYMMLLLMLLLL